MTGCVITAERGAVLSDRAPTRKPVRISAAAAAAIAVRPIPIEAVRAGATVAASIAIRTAATAEGDKSASRENAT